MTLYKLSQLAGVSYQALRNQVFSGAIEATKETKEIIVWHVSDEVAEKYLEARAARQAAKQS